MNFADKKIKLSGVDLPDLISPIGWKIDDSGVYKDIYKKGVMVCDVKISDRPILITGIIESSKTGSLTVNIEWFVCSNVYRSAAIDLSDIHFAGRLLKLRELGAPITKKNSRDLSLFLSSLLKANQFPRATSVDQTGWSTVNGKLTFMMGDRQIADNCSINFKKLSPSNWVEGSVVLDKAFSTKNRNIVKSYGESGNFGDWVVLFEQLSTNPTALTALYLSLAVPALKFVSYIESPVLEFVGDINDKRLILKLAASVWGNPDSSPMAEHEFGTDRACERLWNLNRYLPSFSVGRSINKNRKLGIYRFPEACTGALFVIENSESDPKVRSGGYHARVIRLEIQKIDDKLSATINAKLKTTYGHIGVDVIKFLVASQSNLDNLLAAYNDTGSKYQKLATSNVEGRLVKHLRLIRVGMYLADKIGLPAPQCDILDHVFKAIKSS